jgi:hypothetical protein
MNIDDLLDLLNESEIPMHLKSVSDALLDAESCETEEDFKANLKDAIEGAEALLNGLRDLDKETDP